MIWASQIIANEFFGIQLNSRVSVNVRASGAVWNGIETHEIHEACAMKHCESLFKPDVLI